MANVGDRGIITPESGQKRLFLRPGIGVLIEQGWYNVDDHYNDSITGNNPPVTNLHVDVLVYNYGFKIDCWQDAATPLQTQVTFSTCVPMRANRPAKTIEFDFSMNTEFGDYDTLTFYGRRQVQGGPVISTSVAPPTIGHNVLSLSELCWGEYLYFNMEIGFAYPTHSYVILDNIQFALD